MSSRKRRRKQAAEVKDVRDIELTSELRAAFAELTGRQLSAASSPARGSCLPQRQPQGDARIDARSEKEGAIAKGGVVSAWMARIRQSEPLNDDEKQRLEQGTDMWWLNSHTTRKPHQKFQQLSPTYHSPLKTEASVGSVIISDGSLEKATTTAVTHRSATHSLSESESDYESSFETSTESESESNSHFADCTKESKRKADTSRIEATGDSCSHCGGHKQLDSATEMQRKPAIGSRPTINQTLTAKTSDFQKAVPMAELSHTQFGALPQMSSQRMTEFSQIPQSQTGANGVGHLVGGSSVTVPMSKGTQVYFQRNLQPTIFRSSFDADLLDPMIESHTPADAKRRHSGIGWSSDGRGLGAMPDDFSRDLLHRSDRGFARETHRAQFCDSSMHSPDCHCFECYSRSGAEFARHSAAALKFGLSTDELYSDNDLDKPIDADDVLEKWRRSRRLATVKMEAQRHFGAQTSAAGRIAAAFPSALRGHFDVTPRVDSLSTANALNLFDTPQFTAADPSAASFERFEKTAKSAPAIERRLRAEQLDSCKAEDSSNGAKESQMLAATTNDCSDSDDRRVDVCSATDLPSAIGVTTSSEQKNETQHPFRSPPTDVHLFPFATCSVPLPNEQMSMPSAADFSSVEPTKLTTAKVKMEVFQRMSPKPTTRPSHRRRKVQTDELVLGRSVHSSGVTQIEKATQKPMAVPRHVHTHHHAYVVVDDSKQCPETNELNAALLKLSKSAQKKQAPILRFLLDKLRQKWKLETRRNGFAKSIFQSSMGPWLIANCKAPRKRQTIEQRCHYQLCPLATSKQEFEFAMAECRALRAEVTRVCQNI